MSVLVVHYPQGKAVVYNYRKPWVNPSYAMGNGKPNYPVPALLPKQTFDSLFDLGFVSAWNGFDVELVFNQFIKR